MTDVPASVNATIRPAGHASRRARPKTALIPIVAAIPSDTRMSLLANATAGVRCVNPHRNIRKPKPPHPAACSSQKSIPEPIGSAGTIRSGRTGLRGDETADIGSGNATRSRLFRPQSRRMLENVTAQRDRRDPDAQQTPFVARRRRFIATATRRVSIRRSVPRDGNYGWIAGMVEPAPRGRWPSGRCRRVRCRVRRASPAPRRASREVRLGSRHGPLLRDVCSACPRDRDYSVREPAIRAHEGGQRHDNRRSRRCRAHSGLGRDRIARSESGWSRARRKPRRADRVHRGYGLAVGRRPSLGVLSRTCRRRSGYRRGSRLDPGSADGVGAGRGGRITLARTGRGDAPGDCDLQRDLPADWRSHQGPESGRCHSWRDFRNGCRSASRGEPGCRMVCRVNDHLLRPVDHRRGATD